MNNIVKSKNGMYVIPGVASALIPGLGQLLKGHIPKAILFFAVFVAWGLFLGWLISWIPLVGWIAGPLLWLINVGDALLNSNSNNPS
jgi:TM2 domain-containing membrane protein YozV